MKINGKEYLNPQQQLVENTIDIEKLKEVIKPVYKTTDTTLTSSSVSVATANVDGLGTATEGWLLDPNGLLFKITANDGTTTTLKYYSDLKGPQGEPGAALNIDDSTTSATKVWSSQKINNEVSKAKDKGVYWTSTLPTPVDGTYTFGNLDISNINISIPFKTGDLIIYVDDTDPSNPVVSKILQMDNVSDPDNVTAFEVGNIGGGKQLYQHNIQLYQDLNTSLYKYRLRATIINDNPNTMSTSDVSSYIALTNNLKILATGKYMDGSGSYDKVYLIFSLFYDGTNLKVDGILLGTNNNGTYGADYGYSRVELTLSGTIGISDIVVTL